MRGEETVEDLLKDIDRRHLILPEFQRGYVWTRDQVRAFAGSLYRGYPSGSFLIWKTPNPGRIRGMTQPEDDSAFYNLILDGQQRLTSLYTLMRGEPPPFYEGEKLFFDLYFNLIDETFSYFKPMTMKGRAEWIPVTSFFKEGLAKFIQLRSDGDDEAKKLYFENLDRLQKLEAIKTYPYYMKTITEPRMDRVVDIFNLVNSSGTALSKSDLALAYICSAWPEARDSFKSAQARFSQHHFDFSLEFLTRATATVATGSGLYEPLYRTDISAVKQAWQRVETILEYLINILRGNAHIDSSRDLRSPMPLITLINYLSRKGGTFSTDAETRDLLHWMYAALMWGRYTGSSETKLNADIASLDLAAPANALRENLLQQRGRLKVEPRDLDKAGTRSPFFTMAYIVARSKGALDWFSGQALRSAGIGSTFAVEAHHIFPSSLLYKHRYSSSDPQDKQRVNEIANLAFINKGTNIKISNKDPLGYLRDVRQRFPGALEAQFVPMDEALWTIDRYEEFVAARRRLIADAINRFMDEMQGQSSDGRGETIDDLIAQGENKHVEFKSSFRHDVDGRGIPEKVLQKEVTKSLAAFLNTDGGTLLIGVTDDGSILGISEDMKKMGKGWDGFQLTFTSVVNSMLGADIAPLIDLTQVQKDGKSIAVVHCEPAHRAIYLQEDGKYQLYVRSGSSSQALPLPDAMQYAKARWG